MRMRLRNHPCLVPWLPPSLDHPSGSPPSSRWIPLVQPSLPPPPPTGGLSEKSKQPSKQLSKQLSNHVWRSFSDPPVRGLRYHPWCHDTATPTLSPYTKMRREGGGSIPSDPSPLPGGGEGLDHFSLHSNLDFSLLTFFPLHFAFFSHDSSCRGGAWEYLSGC